MPFLRRAVQTLAPQKFLSFDPLPKGTPKSWMDWIQARNIRLGNKTDKVKFDQESVFLFSTETVRELLNGAGVENLVLGFGCRPKGEKYTRLRPFLYSVKTVEENEDDENTKDEEPIDLIRPHLKFEKAFDANGKIKPNKKIKYSKFINRQMSFLRRNMLLETIDDERIFKAINEFNGFSHTDTEWEELLKDPNDKIIFVVLGVDKTDESGKTKPMVGTVKTREAASKIEKDVKEDKYTLYDNGSQCCPNEI